MIGTIAEILGALTAFTLLALLVWKVVYAKNAPLGKTWAKVIVGPIFLLIMLPGIQGFYSQTEQPAQPAAKQPALSKYDDGPPEPQEMLELVNEERAKAGVAPLQLDERLNASAQMKANDMSANNYFEHDNPTTGKRGTSYIFEATGSLCAYGGENIVDNINSITGEVYGNTSQGSVSAWINSKGHHDIMTNPSLTLTGFGIAGTKVVQHFCQPA